MAIGVTGRVQWKKMSFLSSFNFANTIGTPCGHVRLSGTSVLRRILLSKAWYVLPFFHAWKKRKRQAKRVGLVRDYEEIRLTGGEQEVPRFYGVADIRRVAPAG